MARSIARPVVFDKSMPQPDLPPKVCALINRFATPFKNWLTMLIIHLFGANLPHHFLVQVNTRCDFSKAIELCKSYYTDGKGRDQTYTVEQLFRAEFVRAYYGSCGNEELSHILQTNVVARVFVGLSFFSPVPSDSTLRLFNIWLCENHPTLLFTDVLAFVERVDPEDPETTLHAIDTFALLSPVAPQEPAVLLMRLCATLITVWQKHGGAILAALVPADLDLEKMKTGRAARSREKAVRQLQYAVRDAKTLIAALNPALEQVSEGLRTQVETLIGYIEKVIADETTTNKAGEVVRRTKKGTYRLVSEEDVEATFRKHSDDEPALLAANAAIITTQTRIRSVAVMTGATPDSELVKPTLAFMKDHDIPFPSVLGGDMAFGSGAVRCTVDALTDGATLMVARIPPAGGKDPNRYGPAEFRVQRDEEGVPQVCTCPNGQESTIHYTSGTGQGHRFHYTPEVCKACPLWNECRGPNGNVEGHRTVFISDYHGYLREARHFNATPQGQALLKGRWFVEQKIAFLVRYNGCRRARRVGLKAAEFQLLQACAVRNLQMLFAREHAEQKRQQRATFEAALLQTQEAA